MKKYILFICLLLLQFFVVAHDFSAVNSFFLGKVRQNELTGEITLVAREGQIVHFHPYGSMDVDKSILMDKDAIIPIASMTKVATSIGILIFQEERKLNIDDPVEKYLPAFHNLKVYIKHKSPGTKN